MTTNARVRGQGRRPTCYARRTMDPRQIADAVGLERALGSDAFLFFKHSLI